MLLVLLAEIPALALMFYATQAQRQFLIEEEEANLTRLTHLVAVSQERTLTGARQLLMAVAGSRAIRESQPTECATRLAALLDPFPAYTSLSAVAADGDVLCSAPVRKRPVNVGDRSWFRRVAETGEFAVGGYELDRVSGKPAVTLAYPVRDWAGRISGAVTAGLDPDWLGKVAGDLDLPVGAAVFVTNSQGMILSQFPDPGRWVGRAMPDQPAVKAVLRRMQGTAEVPGFDGALLLYAFGPVLPLSETGLYVSVGIPKETVFAAVDRASARGLLGLVLVGVLVLAAAWVGSDFFVLQRLDALIRATKRLSSGDPGARTGVAYGADEVSRLARTFDEMAESLEVAHRSRDEAHRVRQEAERQAGEARLASVLDITTDAIFSVDDAGDVVLFNKGAEEIFGYAAGDVLGRPLDPLLLSWSAQVLRREIEELAAAPERGRRLWRQPELFGRRKEGAHFPAEVSISKVTQGDRTTFTVIMRDITERREAEERTRLILDTAYDAFISIDAAGRIVDWNRQAEETFGWPREEVVGRSLADTIIPPPYREEHRRGLDQYRATGAGAALNRRLEIPAQRRGGEVFPIEMTIVPVRAGDTYLFASFLRDVSERKRAEEVLYRLASLVESSDDAIISTTLAGAILTWNAAAERIYGYAEEEALGRALSFLVPSDRAAEPPGTLARIARGERIESYETVRVRKDGTLIDVALTTSPLQNADGDIVGASEIARDITERKRDHVKSDFISLVSHQLRTPVAELKGYIDNMLAGLTGSLTAKQAVYLQEMQTTNSRNYHLITSLLDVSRIERGVISVDLQPAGLEDIIARALRPHLEKIAEKGLRLALPGDETAMAVLADEDKMIEALGNVVENAVRYTEAGAIAIRTWTDDTYAYVEVADTGRGIAADVLGKLFTKNQILSGEPTSEGGSGLGLYVAKAFMRLQRGDITVTSLVGRGSAFVLKIPLDVGARGAGREVHVHRV